METNFYAVPRIYEFHKSSLYPGEKFSRFTPDLWIS